MIGMQIAALSENKLGLKWCKNDFKDFDNYFHS